MDFELKLTDFALKLMDFAFKMMNLVFKMMIVMQTSRDKQYWFAIREGGRSVGFL